MTTPRSTSTSQVHFGVDIGGTGIKGAPVDLATGKLTAERVRIATPHPATPEAVGKVVAQVVDSFGWKGPIGVTFPAAIKGGVALTAANVDKKWIGTNIEQTLSAATGSKVVAVNDADAAGVAEMVYGAGRGEHGVVLMTTFGTGIGTAVFLHGQLLPNTEFGHIEIDGKDAEKGASEIAREKKGLSYKKWAKRVDRYLRTLEALFAPDIIIIGGGASRKGDKFIPLLKTRAKVVAATLENDAGIVGAAVVAASVDVTRSDVRHVTKAQPAKRTVTKRVTKKAAPAAKAAGTTKAAPVKRATTKRTATTRTAATKTAAAPAKRAAFKRAPVPGIPGISGSPAATSSAQPTAKRTPAKKATS